MGKGKTLAAAEFPEAMIQHIQSFMNAKEAAQTTLLSKSWYNAWLTRPNLDFDQKHFANKSDKDTEASASRLWKFVNKILQRYDKLNLKIHTLRLYVHGSYDAKHYSYSLVDNLIKKAIRMGATDLDFKFHGQNREFSLPREVFGSEDLIRLCVSGCKIVDEKVCCTRLKFLSLDSVCAEGDIIWNIISSCPLIEKLSLSECTHLFNTPSPAPNGVNSSVLMLSPFIELGKRNVEPIVDGPIILYEFHKLKQLFLSGIKIHSLFFHDCSSKFPCLKDLALYHCYGHKIIHISSPSLECIYIKGYNFRKKYEFDVPNIRKFTFLDSRLGPDFPSLSFKTTTSTWESHISIDRGCYAPHATWFLELNRLLNALSLSKVNLSLEILSEKSLDCGRKLQGLPKPEVENLTISGPCSVCPDLFYSLFQCCRPIYINQYWFPITKNARKKIKDFKDFVYKRLVVQVSLNSCFAYQRMSGWHDLEKVSVEFYDEAVSAWCPRLLDSQGADEQKNRLHIKWRH